MSGLAGKDEDPQLHPSGKMPCDEHPLSNEEGEIREKCGETPRPEIERTGAGEPKVTETSVFLANINAESTDPNFTAVGVRCSSNHSDVIELQIFDVLKERMNSF